MSDNIYIEIKNETCIICLEKMDLDEDYLTTVCVKCDVKAHVSCLNEWYQKKKQKLCPICLKTEKYYLKKLINNDNNFIENDEEHNILNNQNNQNNDLYSDNEDLNENSDDEINNDEINNDIENTNEYIINNYYRLNINNRFRCVLICVIIVFMFIITYILNLNN